MWLSWLERHLSTERSQVRFQVRPHDWIVGSGPLLGRVGRRGNRSVFLSCCCFCLSLSPLLFLSLKSIKHVLRWVYKKRKCYSTKKHTIYLSLGSSKKSDLLKPTYPYLHSLWMWIPLQFDYQIHSLMFASLAFIEHQDWAGYSVS